MFIYVCANLKTRLTIKTSDWNEGKKWDICKFFSDNIQADNWQNEINKKLTQNFLSRTTIFCDSGTAFKTYEISITDKDSNNILNNLSYGLNSRKNIVADNFILGFKLTNNFTELYAIFLSILEAQKTNIKNIASDSAISVFFWLSKYNQTFKKIKNISQKNLYEFILTTYISFVEDDGNLEYIPREKNPADLKTKFQKYYNN